MPVSNENIRDQIGRLARELHGDPGEDVVDPEGMLLEVTEAAVRVLPGVDHAGVTLVTRRGSADRLAQLTSTAATGPVPKTVDALQGAHNEGPCFDAIWRERTIRIDDVQFETRWPAFVDSVRRETPVRSSLSMQLFIGDYELGALNLYSETPRLASPSLEDHANDLATHAAIALLEARRGQQFRSALASRDVIGQAKGMLMERFSVDATDAFSLLKRLSQERNIPLAQLAEHVIAAEKPPRP